MNVAINQSVDAPLNVSRRGRNMACDREIIRNHLGSITMRSAVGHCIFSAHRVTHRVRTPRVGGDTVGQEVSHHCTEAKRIVLKSRHGDQ